MSTDDDRKSDLDKFGLFQQYPYMSDPFVDAAKRGDLSTVTRDKQLGRQPFKPCSTTNQGCFSRFQRAFEGEVYRQPARVFWRYNQSTGSERMTGTRIFHRPGVSQRPEGAGSFYGTFSGPVAALERATKTIPSGTDREIATNKRGVLTSPSKHGTGYGYVGVTFAKYPPHQSEPYGMRLSQEQKEDRKRPQFQFVRSLEFFGPDPYKRGSESQNQDISKLSEPDLMPRSFVVDTSRVSRSIGPFPKHERDPYDEKKGDLFPPIRTVVNNSGQVFGAIPGSKSTRTCSILSQNVHKVINTKTADLITKVFSWSSSEA